MTQWQVEIRQKDELRRISDFFLAADVPLLKAMLEQYPLSATCAASIPTTACEFLELARCERMYSEHSLLHRTARQVAGRGTRGTTTAWWNREAKTLDT